MKRFTGTLLDRAHSLLISVPVTVLYAGTDDPADLYNDDLIRIGNPIITDETGSFAFRIRSGVYDFVDANNIFLMKDVQIFDFLNPAEWTSLWDFPPTGFIIGSDARQNIYVLGETLLASSSSWWFGGGQNGNHPVITLDGANQAQPLIEGLIQVSDEEPVFQVDYLGRINWGAGAANPPDVGLQRVEAGRLEVVGSLQVTEEFAHLGETLGFYGAPPVTQPFVSIVGLDVLDDQATYDLANALASLGLVRSEILMYIHADAPIAGEMFVENTLSVAGANVGSDTVGSNILAKGILEPYFG